MIELSTGTLQTASAAIANSLQNQYAKWFNRPEMAGRYTWKDFMWGMNAWRIGSEKIDQMVWDCGMLTADANDIKNAEFYGGNKFDLFKSEAAFALNRMFFNHAITHTFLAQVKHLGIQEAYVKVDGRWVYDETKDPRFFAYDPQRGIGEKAPETDDEKKRYSLWLTTRQDMAHDGTIDPVTGRMKLPFNSYQRTEIKLYATRMVGSFSKDNTVHGSYYAVIRAMSAYKKWAYQKIANYYTPTIKNSDLYGHYEQELQEDGTYKTVWVGDDFQGILQTLGYMVKEIASLRGMSALRTLNQYQLENLTKLLSDLALMFAMLLLGLPLVAAIESEEVNEKTGEITRIKSPFARSQLGQSAYAALSNATNDLFFIASLPGLTQSMAPSWQILGTSLVKGVDAFSMLLHGEDGAMQKALEGMGTVGLARTLLSTKDLVTDFADYKI
jgi:hypothetical protein